VFKYIRNESGQTIVLVALMIFVLLGFGALAVDVGAMTVQRSKLQNAADSAALAGAMALDEAESVVKNEIRIQVHDNINKDRASNIGEANANLLLLNAEVTSVINNSDNTVLVNIEQVVPKFFGGIFSSGSSEMSVKAKAKMNKGNPFDNFDYAIFQGNRDDKLDLKFTGNNNNISGNVHSNNLITGKADIKGNVTARDSIGSSINAVSPGVKTVGVGEIDMPTYDITEIKKQALILSGDQAFSADQINDLLAVNKIIYVDGMVDINGAGVNAHKGSIIATGDIKFNGQGVIISEASSPLCLYSLNGNILFDGTNPSLHGILFAPNGTIKYSGGDGQIRGSIIADKIDISGGKMNVQYDPEAKTGWPSTGKIIKLVE